MYIYELHQKCTLRRLPPAPASPPTDLEEFECTTRREVTCDWMRPARALTVAMAMAGRGAIDIAGTDSIAIVRTST